VEEEERRKDGRKTTIHRGGWVVVVVEKEGMGGLVAQDKVRKASKAGVRVLQSEERKTCSASQQ
jgi:cation transport ATPase